MEADHHSGQEQLYLEALQQLRSTIELLDRANAPGHIACHIDLALHQLEDVIGSDFTRARVVQIERNAAPQ